MDNVWAVALIVAASFLQTRTFQKTDRIIVRRPTFEIVSIMHPGEQIYLCYADVDFVSGEVIEANCKPAVPNNRDIP